MNKISGKSSGKSSGFTLIEVMVAVLVVAILAAVAIPSFSSIINRNRLTNDANTLLAVLTYARSEAISRNDQVVVCRSRDGTACGSGTAWQDGLIVYADADGDGALDAGEPVLRVENPLTRSSTISTTSNVADATGYQPSGLWNGGSGGATYTLSSVGDSSYTKQVVIGATGRPRVE